MSLHMCILMYTCMYLQTYARVCVCVLPCISVCTCTHRHKHINTLSDLFHHYAVKQNVNAHCNISIKLLYYDVLIRFLYFFIRVYSIKCKPQKPTYLVCCNSGYAVFLYIEFICGVTSCELHTFLNIPTSKTGAHNIVSYVSIITNFVQRVKKRQV